MSYRRWPEITWLGLFVALLCWVALNAFAAYEAACAPCGSGFLFLHGIIVMGMLVPSAFVGLFASGLGGKSIHEPLRIPSLLKVIFWAFWVLLLLGLPLANLWLGPVDPPVP
jgi:hypothetical protein